MTSARCGDRERAHALRISSEPCAEDDVLGLGVEFVAMSPRAASPGVLLNGCPRPRGNFPGCVDRRLPGPERVLVAADADGFDAGRHPPAAWGRWLPPVQLASGTLRGRVRQSRARRQLPCGKFRIAAPSGQDVKKTAARLVNLTLLQPVRAAVVGRILRCRIEGRQTGTRGSSMCSDCSRGGFRHISQQNTVEVEGRFKGSKRFKGFRRFKGSRGSKGSTVQVRCFIHRRLVWRKDSSQHHLEPGKKRRRQYVRLARS